MIINITHCPLCENAANLREASLFHHSSKRSVFCIDKKIEFYHITLIHKPNKNEIAYILFTLGDVSTPVIKVSLDGKCQLKIKDGYHDFYDNSGEIIDQIERLDDDKVKDIFTTLKSIRLFE